MLITTPAWLSQPWFLGLLKFFVKNSLLLPVLKDLLRDPAGMLNLFTATIGLDSLKGQLGRTDVAGVLNRRHLH